MKNFEFDSYSNFLEAEKSTESTQIELSENLNDVHRNIVNVDTDDIFTGPVCDNAMEEWILISEQIKKDISYMNAISSYINTASSNYKSSDNKNATDIGGV